MACSNSNGDVDIDTIVADTNENLKIDDSVTNKNGSGESDAVNTAAATTDSSATTTATTDETMIKTINGNIDMDTKQKKKLDKFIDNFLKKNGLIATNITIEDKYYALAQKYSDQIEQLKQKDNQIKDAQKNVLNANKQRDQLQHDYSKALLARNKLESLCRELQRHNKAIKEENLARSKEEEEKRKDISTKFQAAIDEINTQVNSNTERNNSLIQENVQLAAKLKTLLEQYETREQHMDKVLKHKDLENQLMAAKFQQSELRIVELSERNKQLEEHLTELTKKCAFHMDAEGQLKNQLKVYTEKYEEFQGTLNKSNEVFNSFRTEMDKMTKKVKKLEQETVSWKGKYENCNKSLLQSIDQLKSLEKELKKQQVKANTMEQLSRTLQTERNELTQKLKSYENVNGHKNGDLKSEVNVENKENEEIHQTSDNNPTTTTTTTQPTETTSSA